MRVRFAIGPVDAAIARTWLANSRRILESVRRRPDVPDFIVSEPLLDVLDAYLAAWQDVARSGGVFYWETDADPVVVGDVAAEWVKVDSLTDDQLRELGCAWAPKDCAPFYEAVLVGVAAALSGEPQRRDLVDDLRRRSPERDDG